MPRRRMRVDASEPMVGHVAPVLFLRLASRHVVQWMGTMYTSKAINPKGAASKHVVHEDYAEPEVNPHGFAPHLTFLYLTPSNDNDTTIVPEDAEILRALLREALDESQTEHQAPLSFEVLGSSLMYETKQGVSVV